jgi:NAD+ synthase (glutamine-hydrolysing)
MTDERFFSPDTLGFVRIAVASPELRVADVAFNTQKLIDAMGVAAGRGVRLILFPELCITAYSCGDLFYQPLLLEQALAGLASLADATAKSDIAAVVGLPLAVDGKLYNVASLLAGGKVVGFVPKSFLPTTGEFYEERWFTPAARCTAHPVRVGDLEVPFGPDLVFDALNMPSLVVGIEICEDLWAVSPPSGDLAQAGATVLLNGSASNELLGKVEYRRDLVRQQSARSLAAYLYAGAGPGESTTDLVWAGHSMIAENGAILAETERFKFETQMAIADVDVQRLQGERLRSNTYSAAEPVRQHRKIPFVLPGADRADAIARLIRPLLSRMPFVPADPERRAEHCREIFNIQSVGLAKRLRHTATRNVTIGLSGGLDSTLALLVTVHAFDIVGLPHDGIHAVTMPGFGTTARTRGNAAKLAEELGVSFQTIPIADAVRQHFHDIGHDENKHDITYENAQARERTQILMDLANEIGGFVVGTGDLSELALGWATYNGDHMSMYHVNAGVPKTLVRYLVDWAADEEFQGDAATVLHDISATPISPELLPLGKEGALEQKTEETVGPYTLHDFFLYNAIRYGFPPRKVFVLARQAFDGEYAPEVILKWLRVFYKRFFSQQFKRSAMPDGPKVGSVALSPRGDWRMPSDASAAGWLAEVDAIERAIGAARPEDKETVAS